jgi:hypothetical protein
MAQGKEDEALITGMKGAQMGPPIFNMGVEYERTGKQR